MKRKEAEEVFEDEDVLILESYSEKKSRLEESPPPLVTPLVAQQPQVSPPVPPVVIPFNRICQVEEQVIFNPYQYKKESSELPQLASLPSDRLVAPSITVFAKRQQSEAASSSHVETNPSVQTSMPQQPFEQLPLFTPFVPPEVVTPLLTPFVPSEVATPTEAKGEELEPAATPQPTTPTPQPTFDSPVCEQQLSVQKESLNDPNGLERALLYMVVGAGFTVALPLFRLSIPHISPYLGVEV